MTRQYRKGQWVRYTGPSGALDGMLGCVDCHYNGSMIMVNFVNGKRYGCYAKFLTHVFRRTAAVEVARIALELPTRQ